MIKTKTSGTINLRVTKPSVRTPKIKSAIAFARNAKKELYLEVADFKASSRLELINLSANPDAAFDSAEKITLSFDPQSDLAPSGLRQEQLGFHITQEQMTKLQLEPGDRFSIRAIDETGASSSPTFGAFESKLQNRDRFGDEQEPSFSALMGIDGRETYRADYVLDTRAPVIVENKISIEEGVLLMNGALEPNARLEVLNQRTGLKQEANADTAGMLELSLSVLEEGDTLLLTPFDEQQNRGKALEIRYQSQAPMGRTKPLNLMGLRFQEIQ